MEFLSYISFAVLQDLFGFLPLETIAQMSFLEASVLVSASRLVGLLVAFTSIASFAEVTG